MPVLNGVSYQIAQACLDIRAQMKKHGIQNLGIEGDLRHQAGCGDHVPWMCTGHYGWIMAIDIGWGPVRPGKVQFTPARLRQYLLPRLRAHSAEWDWVKYIITGNKLNDTRPQWNLEDQWGPDGDDHMHISVDNDNKTTHTTLIDDCMAWLDAGMPNPVTFRPSAATGTTRKAESALISLKVGTTLHSFGIGTLPGPDTGWLYHSNDGGANWVPILKVGASFKGPWQSVGVGACTPDGTGIVVSTVATDGRIYYHWFKTGDPRADVNDLTKYEQYGPALYGDPPQLQKAGGRVDVAAIGDGLVLASLRGTNGHFYRQEFAPATGVFRELVEPNSAARFL